LERPGRPSLDSGDHYYVALSAWEADRFLLETTHERVWRFSEGQVGSAWAHLPLGRDVDLSAAEDAVFVLTRALNTPVGDVLRYPESTNGRSEKAEAVASFQPGIALMQPRQVVATGSTVFVLDRAGRRLLALEPKSGALRAESLFSDRRAVSAFWAKPDQGQPVQPGQPELILAGRDVLYFHSATAPPAVGEGDGQGRRGGESGATALPNDVAWLESLRGLEMPIRGARVSRRDFQMPGAPRHYRLGVHEGIDFYGGTAGVSIGLGTPVRAVADGTVIRALLDYQPLTASQSSQWSSQVREAGYTPPEILDGYRGRQVWIRHDNGLVSRYAHLSAIASGIVEGAAVLQGQVIGKVGNSGTPESVGNSKGEMHLHLELWAGDRFVGQFLRPIEAREWLERILR
jgi:murein DD-endopeptidase MepM/ murein hydrolase activator NlpD